MRLTFLCLAATVCCMAQSDSPVDPVDPATQPAKVDKRSFGVLPNYRVVDSTVPFEPITTRQKFTIGAKDSFDYPVYFTAALFASISHLENQNPAFGQGLKGFGNRYIRSYGDQTLGNILTEGAFPSLLKEDPRYFRRGGDGRMRDRVWYAATRVLVSRTDKGTWGFNYAEILGNASAVAISNAYYPETRTVHDNMAKLGLQVGTDAISNVLKEIWPDVKHRLQQHHAKSTP